MSRFMKRALVALLALMLTLGAVTPAAFATVVTREQAETLARINVWENGSVVLRVGRSIPLYMAKQVLVDGQYKLYLKEGTINFTSDNPFVASVVTQTQTLASGNTAFFGQLNALNPGVANITLQASDGTAYLFTVTVEGDKFEFATNALTSYVGVKTDLAAMLSNDLFSFNDVTWKTSKKSVVTVTKKGVITAKAKGKATITATAGAGANQKTAKITVTVKKNKLDKIQPKPTVSMAGGKDARMMLKSVEIQGTNKIVVEYYLINASKNRLKKIDYIKTKIYATDRTTGKKITLINGKSGAVSPSMSKKSVKTIKVTYTGAKVKNTDVNLKNCSGGMEYTLNYYARFGR